MQAFSPAALRSGCQQFVYVPFWAFARLEHQYVIVGHFLLPFQWYK